MQKAVRIVKLERKSVWRRMGDDIAKHWQLYLLTLAPMAIIILFKYVPMYGIQIAFRKFKITKGITSGDWVGLKYFKSFFENPMAGRYIYNTIAISLYELATFPLSLVFALMLNQVTSKRFCKFVQMISYAPYFISTVVMCGTILQFLAGTRRPDQCAAWHCGRSRHELDHLSGALPPYLCVERRLAGHRL